jgi:hypothetical protein
MTMTHRRIERQEPKQERDLSQVIIAAICVVGKTGRNSHAIL